MKDLNCVAFIFARGGSKGIPKKNIIPLAGKPLIAYSIETALACPSIHRVIVSTDDDEIATVAKRYGAEVPFMRPKTLSEDRSAEWQAWQHAIQWVRQEAASAAMDIFVSLSPTSPLRHVSDVERCVQALLNTEADIVITVKPAERNPYFNMVRIDKDGFSHLICDSDKPARHRQDAPEIYDVTTVAYVARPDYILRASNIFEGWVQSVLIPSERAIDIDTLLDLKIAKALMKENV